MIFAGYHKTGNYFLGSPLNRTTPGTVDRILETFPP
jgi:hypothetical protein